MQSLIAWVVTPVAVLGVGHGLGALLAWLCRLTPPVALLAPVGTAAAVAISLTGYVVGLRGLVAPLLLVALALAGWVLFVRSRGLPRPGLGAVVWSATYGLYILPVVFTGHWTWLGYNFVNDTSVQLLLADWLPTHGRETAERLFSTPLDVVSSYIDTGYPMGSHALLAATDAIVPVRAEVLYQPFIAVVGAMGAVALASLAGRVAPPRWAAFAGFAAMASNLLYQYALQGNMKEILTATMLATTAAVAGWSLGALREAEPAARGRLLTGSAVLIAAPIAATVDVLSTAGGPYAALIVLVWVALLLVYRLVPGPRAFFTALAGGTAAIVALTAVQLSTLVTFGKATTVTYAAPDRASDLGHLVGPLDVRQSAGIWLIGDYRFPPTGYHATLTDIGVWGVVALAVVALVWFARRRSADVLLFALPVILIVPLVTPRVAPYADAKTFMLMAPGVTLLAALGAAALGTVRRPLGRLAAAALMAGVLASDALAYHAVRYAPTERMEAMRDLNRHFAGQGPILFNEPEEFAKNFMGDTRLNVGAEAITPRHTELRVPQQFGYLWFDLDEQTLDSVNAYPLIAFRRSPVASRPPADFERVYQNHYYDVWRRTDGPEVLEHFPLQLVNQGATTPDCAQVRELAKRTRPGEQLVAAPALDVVRLDTLTAKRSPGWVPNPVRPGTVQTRTPGSASAIVRVRKTGRYRAWIAGSFLRDVEGSIDGRPIGAAKGVNTVGQWHDIGTLDVTAGRHELTLRRGSGTLSPGDGFAGELGPLALERIEPIRPLERFDAGEADQLCNREWDWIERVRR